MKTIRSLLERGDRLFPANPAVAPLAGGPPLTGAGFATRVRRVAGTFRSLTSGLETAPPLCAVMTRAKVS